MEVDRVEVDVGERRVVERPGPERADDLVELFADPGDLGLGDAGVRTECDDQVIDAARGHAVDVGLHHDRVERLIDAAPGLEDGRKVRALAQLGDPYLDVAGLGRQQLGAGAVAFGDTVLGALIPLSADHTRGFELDKLLQHGADRLADHVDTIAGAKRVEEL